MESRFEDCKIFTELSWRLECLVEKQSFGLATKEGLRNYSGLITNYFAISLNDYDESRFVQVMAFLPALSSVCGPFLHIQ